MKLTCVHRAIITVALSPLACFPASACSLAFPLDDLESGGSAIRPPGVGAAVEAAADVGGSDGVLHPSEAGEDATLESDANADAMSGDVVPDTSVDAFAKNPQDAAAAPDGPPETEGGGCNGNCPVSVGGTIVGISPGDAIVLQSQGADGTSVTADGAFELQLPYGSTYGVSATVASASPIPEQCTVLNGNGVVGGPVDNLQVICLPTDVLYYFPLDGDANDRSGHGNNGVLNGGVSPTTDRFSNPNSAYTFDGATGYISAPGGLLPLNAANRTLTLWIETLGSTDDFGVVYWGSGNCTAQMFGLGVKNGDFAALWEGCNDDISRLRVRPNVWTFVAVVFSAAAPNNYTLYANTQALNVQLTAAPATQPGPFMIGYDEGSEFFHGNLDSVRVYGRALTSSEIEGIYASP